MLKSRRRQVEKTRWYGPEMALQATPRMVELLRPDGCRVRVEIGDALASLELEAGIAQLLLEVEGTDGDICDALTEFAQASGLTTNFFVGAEFLIVEVSDMPRSRPDGSA